MTTPNGHHQVDVFEGVELPPDAETQALLELMALADDVEAGRLTDEGHRRARAALAALRRGVEREPSGFRQAVALAQTNLRGSLETLTRAIETANPLRVATWGHTMPQPRQWLVDESLPAGRVALLTGEGGAGKSRLALQLAAGVASGGDHREWIASPHGIMRLGNAVPTNGASVVFASWEDEPEEFYRRLHQISGQAAPWVTPERLQGLRIVNLVGEGPIWAPEQGRHISTMAAITATGERLRRLCEQEDARLLVVDPLGGGLRLRRERAGVGEGLCIPLGRLGAGQRLHGADAGASAEVGGGHLCRFHGLAGRGAGAVDAAGRLRQVPGCGSDHLEAGVCERQLRAEAGAVAAALGYRRRRSEVGGGWRDCRRDHGWGV